MEENTTMENNNDAVVSVENSETKEAVVNKDKEEKVHRYLDPAGISMTEISKDLLSNLGVQNVFGKGVTIQDIINSKKVTIPKLELKTTAIYNIDYLLKFLKVAKKVASNVRISLNTNEPMKMVVVNTEGQEITYYLAPFIEE